MVQRIFSERLQSGTLKFSFSSPGKILGSNETVCHKLI